jgi:diguanylate cyclase (GGDEF)-like protein
MPDTRSVEGPDDEAGLAPPPALERCLGLLGTLDLERLQEEILATLSGATDAQGSALWVADDKGELVLRAWRGLVDREALPGRLDARAGPLGRAFERGLPFEASAASGEALQLPLLAEGEPVGLVLLERRASGAFGAAERRAIAGVGPLVALALRNARRFHALERVGLRDRETGAYHLAYFVDYAGKEFYKARRYGRSFSMAVLSVDNHDEVRREAGREALRAATRALVAATSRAVRDADILARVSDREYYVLLPETDHFGALVFARRAAEEIQRELAVRELEERRPLALALGAATFPQDGEDFDELLHACRARQDEERASLVRRLRPGPAAFWELADALLDGAPVPEGGASARLAADPELFAAVQREAAREIGRDPRQRGVLYVGAPSSAVQAPVLEALPNLAGAARAGDAGARVYLLGPRGPGAPAAREDPDHPLVTQVFLDGDPRLRDHAFLLFLSESAAYGFLEGGGRQFHTSDAPLVDALVARLQTLYDLQPL